MTDTRRQAAEEWVDGAQEEEGLDAPAYCDAEGCLDDGIAYALEHAHLAGQECGEQRAVEGIVRWLRGVKVNGIVCAHLNEFAAEMIERGEWKEGK